MPDGSGPHDPPLALYLNLKGYAEPLSSPQYLSQCWSSGVWVRASKIKLIYALVPNAFSIPHFPLRLYSFKSSLS